LKRIFLITAMILVMAAAVSAQDLTGQMKVNGYAGYTLGFGDLFKTRTAGDYEFKGSAGLCFGGQFFYGLKENIMIGGELMFQAYNFESKYTGPAIPGFDPSLLEFDEGSSELNFLANILYMMNEDDETSFSLIGGLGFYDFGGSEIGFSGGILYEKAMGESFKAFAMPRLHIVMADESVMMFQIAIGATFPIGGGM